MGMLIHKYCTANAILDGVVVAADLTPTMRTGFIHLPLTIARKLTAGDYVNTAGDAGMLSANSTPAISLLYGGSRATWVSSNVDVIHYQFMAPVDFDETQHLYIKMFASMSDVNDTPLLGVSFVEAMSNNNVGGNTAAVSGTTPTEKKIVIAGGTILGGNQWNISITPAAHGTDDLRIDAIWVEYTRK